MTLNNLIDPPGLVGRGWVGVLGRWCVHGVVLVWVTVSVLVGWDGGVVCVGGGCLVIVSFRGCVGISSRVVVF